MTAPRGLFVTLEGGEAVGKSTLAGHLKAALEQAGANVALTREPGGSPLAERVRALLLDAGTGAGRSALTEVLLFFAARSDHLDHTIRPALRRGDWVICDRFTDSTRVYQSIAAGGAEEALIADLERRVVAGTAPDITLVLDLSVEAARARLAARGVQPDAFERKPPDFHEQVRQAFLTIARREPDRCRVIDAGASAEEVAASALAAVLERAGAGSTSRTEGRSR